MGHFPPFLLGSTQLLHHFLVSKKVDKKSKLQCHVLDFMWGLQKGDVPRKEMEAYQPSKAGMRYHEGS